MNWFLFRLVAKWIFPIGSIFVVAGCTSFHPTKSESELSIKESINVTNQQNEGYALLYELVGKEKTSAKF